MTSFDLTTREWIRARRFDGSLSEFLLAILHRALDEARRREGNDHAFWGELWKRRADGLPLRALDAYLDTWQSRFDLFDPDRPFMQVADLRTARDEDFGLERLVADVPTGEQFFTTRAGKGLDWISTSEAARWLVHCQAFDPSGIKSGAADDPRVTGGKGYPTGCGWAGQIGLVLVEGRSLAETLLLNLVFQGDKATGVPIWERDEGHGHGIDEQHPEPDSIIDTLVWQSRRIKLIGDIDRVTRVLVCNGDPFAPHDRFIIETGSGWRRSERQEKKLKRSPVYVPRGHEVDRALWRGLESLLATVISTTSRESPPNKSPQVLEWLAELRQGEMLATDVLLRVRAVGLVYGSNNSVVKTLINDVALLHASVLTNRDLQETAKEAVRHAEGAVHALANLAANLTRASGGEPGGPRSRASHLGYHTLDRAYRHWAMELTADCDPHKLLASWDSSVEDLLWPLAQGLLRDAGTPAFIGRMVDRGGKRRLLDSWQAETRYEWEIWNALPKLPERAKKEKVAVAPESLR